MPLATDPLNMTKIDTSSSLSSRQKSCNACVRGKRRCDKRTPRCTRCAAKGLDCVYHKMPPSQSGGSSSMNANTSPGTSQHLASGQSTGGSTSPEMADVPDFDMGFDYESLGTETSPESMCQLPDQPPQQHHQSHQHQQHQHHDSQLHLGPGLDFDLANFLNTTAHIPNTHTSNLTPSSASSAAHGISSNAGFFASLFESSGLSSANKMDIPPVPFISNALVPMPTTQVPQKVPIRDLSALQPMNACASLDPLAVHDPRSWLGYTVKALTSLHTVFAQTRALPFIHARLWANQLPKPILAVFSAATAYNSRSADNKGWIVKLLADTANSIHRDGEQPATNYEKLARVQALLVLDSIRVFDGDLGLRAAAEREASVLTEWIGELQQLIDAMEAEAMQHAQSVIVAVPPLVPDIPGLDSTATAGMGVGGSAYPSRDRPPKSWDAWVLLESARRTLVFACAFVCMTKLLKSMDVDNAMWRDLRFTASRHLWEAPSSVEFFRSWRDKPQYYIRDFDFKDFWSYARPDDLDEFTKTMLMPYVPFAFSVHVWFRGLN